jgi:hypothetical protein
VPGATIGIAHGRLSETELEEVMLSVVAGTTDILLATTIIESGLDIPRANTIFIDEADGYGRADLDQRTPIQAFRRRHRLAATPPAAPAASRSVALGSGTTVGTKTTPLNAVLPEAMASEVKSESVPLSTLVAAAVSVYFQSVLPLPVM